VNHKLSCDHHDGRKCNCDYEPPLFLMRETVSRADLEALYPDNSRYPRRTPLQLRLARMRACREGRAWVAGQTLYEAWDACEDGAWMLWLASEVDAGRGAVTAVLDWLQAQLCCIREDVPAALAALPDPDRQILLLETAQHVRGQISSGEIARKLGL